MAYTKINWVNGTTPVNDTNMNKIEQGIYDNSLVVDAITNKLNPTDTETYKTAELTEGQITDVIGVSDILIKGQTSQNGKPTPSSPVDVNVVSGSNVINTSSKNLPHQGKELHLDLPVENLFDKDNMIWVRNNNDVYTDENNENSERIRTRKLIQLKGGETYTISGFPQQLQLGFIKFYENPNKTVSSGGTDTKTFTVPTNAPYVIFQFNGTNFTDETNTLMKEVDIILERGSKANAYTPFGTDPIELCKIGDYQDYFYKSGSKWYLHKEINKITSYNGETITTSYISTTGELSTGAKVYYVVTPTDTKITDTTLISQLEAIYNAPLYEQTNITQTNNDLPMVLDITACKDNINGIKAFIRK